jgi:glycosyltransferase involved in cell wall biosynthesis
MRVNVAVHGRFHAFDLARELHRCGHLQELFTTYPASLCGRFLPEDLPVTGAGWLEAWRRLQPKVRPGQRTDAFIARQFGSWLARNMNAPADILTGWSSATLEAITPAKAMGMQVVIERGSTHIGHQQDLLAEAHAHWSAPFTGAEPEIIDRELAEYEAADAIAVPTGIAADSFIARGIPPEKLVINPYGVGLDDFTPPGLARTHHGRPRVLFVGRLGIRKGLPWLLEAFAPHARDAELHLVGPEDGEAEQLFARLPSAAVIRHGPLPRSGVIRAMQEADIFCLPSLEEGLPLSLLQAMATGLPVIASFETGISTVDPDERAGITVPAMDCDALTEAIGTLAGDAGRRRDSGIAARSLVQQGFSWKEYGARAIAAYDNLLGLSA